VLRRQTSRPLLLRRQADSPHPDFRTLYPESGNRKREPKERGFEDTGYGVQESWFRVRQNPFQRPLYILLKKSRKSRTYY